MFAQLHLFMMDHDEPEPHIFPYNSYNSLSHGTFAKDNQTTGQCTSSLLRQAYRDSTLTMHKPRSDPWFCACDELCEESCTKARGEDTESVWKLTKNAHVPPKFIATQP